MSTHTQLMADRRSRIDVPALEREYDAFAQANSSVEDACATWQLSARDLPSAHAAQEALRALYVEVRPALEQAARIAPHLTGYPQRLSHALDAVERGDSDYLTSPLVESFHQVWAELHQDLLVTLGRD
jgi:hypothetical protein